MINRRTFLKKCAWLSSGILLDASFPNIVCPFSLNNAKSQAKSKVAIIRNPAVWQDGRPDPSIIKVMLNDGIRFLTGHNDLVRSWGAVFHPSDRIAIKVNPIARQTGSTKPELCVALAQVINENANISFDRMIIFDVSGDDLRGAGYPLGITKQGIRVCQTQDYSEIFCKDDVKARISRIITDECSALINVPLLKTHKSAGISVALKNHYGSIPTNIVRNDDYRYHMDNFKNLVFLNLMAPIKDKNRLIVVDGLTAQFNKGPGGDPRFQWKFNGIIMGFDPVAVDTICLSIINDKRKDEGLPSLALPYLGWARQQGLGTNLTREIGVNSNVL